MTLSFDRKVFDDIGIGLKKWRGKIEKIFQTNPERLKRFSTVSDKEIERIYTPKDISEQDFDRDLGFPGEYPFTRGSKTNHPGKQFEDNLLCRVKQENN